MKKGDQVIVLSVLQRQFEEMVSHLRSNIPCTCHRGDVMRILSTHCDHCPWDWLQDALVDAARAMDVSLPDAVIEVQYVPEDEVGEIAYEDDDE